MSELRRHARALLDASRHERTPSPLVKQRLLDHLLESAAQSSLAANEPPPLAQRLGVGMKLLIVVVLLGAVWGGLWAASR